jgi:hypothetical protein
MLGGAKITSELEFAREPGPPLFNIISTNAFPAAMLVGIPSTIRLDWTIEQNGDAKELTVEVQE